MLCRVSLTAQIERLTGRVEELIAGMPAARGVDAGGATGPGQDAAVRPAIARLDEVPGISRHTAQVILAETGLDMPRFPTAGHLVSWAKLSPRTIQSGAKSTPGKTGKGNPYLKGALGEVSFAQPDPDGYGVWLATEYIPPAADQDPMDNWGTYVFQVK